jgi:hypothetical protein
MSGVATSSRDRKHLVFDSRIDHQNDRVGVTNIRSTVRLINELNNRLAASRNVRPTGVGPHFNNTL